MHPARLILVCGLPGAGTTTRSVELAERFGAIRMCADDWMELLAVDIWDDDARDRIETIQGNLASTLLRVGTSVIVEWGSWTRRERDRLRDAARAAGGFAHLEFLDAPPDVLWQRIEARGCEQAVGSRAITRADLDGWIRAFERPSRSELATYDPMPAVRADESNPLPTFPY